MIEDGFIKSSDTDRKSYRKLLRATKEGELTRLKRGVYATENALANTMIDIEKIVPGGILCLYSAWHFYEMTTQIPSAFYIAINRDRKVVVPDFPDIQLVYQNANILSIGCVQTQIQNWEVSIYNRERCVCDAIKYRNKIGIDVMAEVLSSYLKISNRNIELLRTYAEHLRVQSSLRRYLEIQL
nr:hypothetical protein [uncultured Bacteroides sp.]